jgi:hypothetical protein
MQTDWMSIVKWVYRILAALIAVFDPPTDPED